MDIHKLLNDDGVLFLWQQILAQFVKKEEGKGLSTNDLTNELLVKIQNAGDSNFDGNYGSLTHQPQINGITLTGNKTLEQLGITKAISDVIGNVTQISFDYYSDVSELPTVGEKGVFYLVPNSGSGKNTLDEYIWVKSKSDYELLGTVENKVDLSGYVKQTDIEPLTNEEILAIIESATAS
ncbi:MAG: hypothetical protein NC489_22950 [Ruminococcus flavefaciens]|nr:hypothetical protein [Ruminococcus flavefaciens]